MKAFKLTPEEIEQCVQDYRESLGDGNMFNVKRDNIACPPAQRPKISFTEESLEMCRQLVNQCDKEIAWNAEVVREGNQFLITDIHIFPQIVTGTTVDVDPTEYALWVAGLPEDVVNNLRCHCHSHVNMGVFSSGTDDGYQQELVEGNVRDYYIFLIFNKRNQIFARIYDVQNNLFYDNQDIDVDVPVFQKSNQVAQMIKDFVRTPSFKTTPNVEITRLEQPKKTRRRAQQDYMQMKLDEIMLNQRRNNYGY